jgi:hypothetical protein
LQRTYESPRYTKGRVDRAGERIATPDQQLDDIVVLENWRASHANILNTFKTILYNRSKGLNVQIAQRLKRRPTIVDKLTREPGMRLSRMHDIAGCRIIFQNMQDLDAFRERMHEGRFDHKRRGVEGDRWNYINRPKPSGYRGIHDVYTYHVEPKKGQARDDQPWNGMLVEIQYRTVVQHAWAAAVELAGLVTENNPKFDRGSESFREFFRISSEILARAFEGSTSCYPNYTAHDLVQYFYEADLDTHLMTLFSEMKPGRGRVDPRNSSILIFRYDSDLFEEQLEIRTFDSMNEAIKEYSRLETDLGRLADIVLVGSRSVESIKSAYRNYFSDASEFISFVEQGLIILTEVAEQEIEESIAAIESGAEFERG